MGFLMKMGILASLVGIAYKIFRKQRLVPAGASAGEAVPVYSSGVMRDAGPANQKFVDKGSWDKVDEQADESFPASDPPSNY